MAEPRFTPRRWSLAAGAFFLTFLLVLYVWLCVEKRCLILGYETDDVSFHIFYYDHGWNLDAGLHTFWMAKGWRLVVDYDVEPKRGAAFFHLTRIVPGEGLGTGWTLYVERPERGHAEYEAERSGVHIFSAKGSSHGASRGDRPEGAPFYDVKYAVWWGLAF